MATYSSSPRVVIDIPKRIAVGVTTDFSVAFKAGDMGGTMVVGEGAFPEGDYTAWYYEVQDGTWKELTTAQFGPASGFPLQDATSYFRVRFNTPSVGTFNVKMKAVSDGAVLAQDSVTVQAVVGETTDELNARIAMGGTVKLDTDVTGSLKINNDVTIDGQGHTLHGNIVLDSTSSTVPYDVVVENLTMRDDGLSTAAKGYGIFGQNQSADTPVRPVNLTVRGCTISGYEKKGIYLTNPLSAIIIDNTIGDVATEPMNTPNTFGDYAVDLNVCGVQGGNVRIVGNTFTGSCGAIGAVKVTQRGGIVDGKPLTDDVNTDIKNPVSAVLDSVVVSGNDFAQMNAKRSDGVANVVLGSSPNTDGTARTYANSYPAEVGAVGETYLNIRGTKDADMTFTMPAGSTVQTASVRTSDGTYGMSIDASAGVTLTGTLRPGANVDLAMQWCMPEGGPAGLGMVGLTRFLLSMPSVSYVTGGLRIPVPFKPFAVVANAKGGADAWYDPVAGTVVLYRGGAEIASGTTVEDLDLMLIGWKA